MDLLSTEAGLRAVANKRRLQILDWLKNPIAHFPTQVSGSLIEDGVCGVSIAQKLGVTQPTASEHLKILSEAGLIRGKRIGQWTVYKRNEPGIKRLRKLISATLKNRE